MVTVRHLQGTFCHLQKVHRKKGHDRRHKYRCKYYVKRNNHCSHRFETCIGSAHCPNYQEHTATPVTIDISTINTSIPYKPTLVTESKNTYEKNMLIYSPKYGPGKILAITIDNAGNEILTIDFHGLTVDFLSKSNDLHIIDRIHQNSNYNTSFENAKFSVVEIGAPKPDSTFNFDIFGILEEIYILHPFVLYAMVLFVFAIIILIYYFFFY